MSEKSEPTTSPPATSSAEVSHAKTSALQEPVPAWTATAPDYGLNMRESFAIFIPATSLWRTSQRFLLGGWVEWSETWPRAGMTVSGTAYPLRPSAHLTGETAFSSSGGETWPTPTARDYKDGSANACKNVPANGLLGREVHARENYQTTGALNPTWVEWLQGFPLGWTDLDVSGTP